MRGAEVAEVPFVPERWGHEPLRLVVRHVAVSAAELQAGSPKAGGARSRPSSCRWCSTASTTRRSPSFIVSDIPGHEQTTAEVEHFHRRRAQIEERFKDAKLGRASPLLAWPMTIAMLSLAGSPPRRLHRKVLT